MFLLFQIAWSADCMLQRWSGSKYDGFARGLSKIVKSLSDDELRPWDGARVVFPVDAPFYDGVRSKFPGLGECTEFRISSGPSILFPVRGRQLSTEQVSFLSCANEESGNPCSLTTNFFCTLLGFPSDVSCGKINQNLGFLADNRATKIITPRDDISRAHGIVRGVLSTPEGRIWAYRLINEIRRVDSNGKGASEHYDFFIPLRNFSRSVVWYLSKEGSYLGLGDRDRRAVIGIDPNVHMDMPCIHKVNGRNNLVNSQSNLPYHKNFTLGCFFHEGVHWYNFLRAPMRFELEAEGYKDIRKITLRDVHFWRGTSGDDRRERASSLPWTLGGVLHLQEIKTVLGSGQGGRFHSGAGIPGRYSVFLNGDDMSENAFRKGLGMPIRGAYVIGFEPFYEDSFVVGRILKSAGASEEDLLRSDGGVRFENDEDGLGNAKFDRERVGGLL
jgi:hypothetical protein